MQMQRINAHSLDINGKSGILDHFYPEDKSGLSWDWALNEIQEGLEDGRCDTKPNGGYVVNGMKPSPFFIEQASSWLQKFDRNKIIRIQMYVAATIHSHLFRKHRDLGQRSLIVQGAGKTAVVVGDQTAVLEPGDIMFLNGDEYHRFTSLGPRFSITISLEDND